MEDFDLGAIFHERIPESGDVVNSLAAFVELREEIMRSEADAVVVPRGHLSPPLARALVKQNNIRILVLPRE